VQLQGTLKATLTDLTVKPHARRNIQLQRAEFVPVRGARRAIRSQEDERGRTFEGWPRADYSPEAERKIGKIIRRRAINLR
jgi:hypothetical protein